MIVLATDIDHLTAIRLLADLLSRPVFCALTLRVPLPPLPMSPLSPSHQRLTRVVCP